jgi:hypothetical protein
MKFRIVIEGKVLGFLPVRVTPIDAKIPTANLDAAKMIAALIGSKPLSFTFFTGTISALVE